MCYIIIINTGKTQVVCANIPNKGEDVATSTHAQERTRTPENPAKTAIVGMVF